MAAEHCAMNWQFRVIIVAVLNATHVLSAADIIAGNFISVDTDAFINPAAVPYLMIALAGVTFYAFLSMLQPSLERYRPNVKKVKKAHVEDEDESSDEQIDETFSANKDFTFEGSRNGKLLAKLMAKKEARKTLRTKKTSLQAKSSKATATAQEYEEAMMSGVTSVEDIQRKWAEQHSVDEDALADCKKNAEKQKPTSTSDSTLQATMASLQRFLEHEQRSQKCRDNMSIACAACSQDFEHCLAKVRVQSAVVEAVKSVYKAQQDNRAVPEPPNLLAAPPGLDAPPGLVPDFQVSLAELSNKIIDLQERATRLMEQSRVPAPPALRRPRVSFDRTAQIKLYEQAKPRTSLSANATPFVPILAQQ